MQENQGHGRYTHLVAALLRSMKMPDDQGMKKHPFSWILSGMSTQGRGPFPCPASASHLPRCVRIAPPVNGRRDDAAIEGRIGRAHGDSCHLLLVSLQRLGGLGTCHVPHNDLRVHASGDQGSPGGARGCAAGRCRRGPRSSCGPRGSCPEQMRPRQPGAATASVSCRGMTWRRWSPPRRPRRSPAPEQGGRQGQGPQRQLTSHGF